eukprot:487822_1
MNTNNSKSKKRHLNQIYASDVPQNTKKKMKLNVDNNTEKETICKTVDLINAALIERNLTMYMELSNNINEMITKHVSLAGEMRKLQLVRSYLIKEIHEKKSKQKKQKYYPISSNTKDIYNKILFIGRSILTHRDPWPCHFQSELENIMEKEIHDKQFKDQFWDMYYNNRNNPYAAFDETIWSLSTNTKSLSENDIKIMKKFRDYFLECLTKYTMIIGTKRSKQELKRVKKWFDRCEIF